MNIGERSALIWLFLAVVFAPGCRGILGVEKGTLRAGAGGSGGVTDSGSSNAGGAVSYRSCIDLPATCGPTGDADCCTSRLIPGGSFRRSYDGETYVDDGYPASVSRFVLDNYEVTVGRFRKFVDAYPRSKPVAGAGKNRNNPDDPGWDGAWSPEFSIDHLPPTQRELESVVRDWCYETSWTDKPGANESLPIHCINWYVAFAFCIWDGGRLPTEAEWNYAAAGGDEQRVYPWGKDTPDDTYAVYCGEGIAGAGGAGGFGPIAAGAPSSGGSPGPGPAPGFGPCPSGRSGPEPVGSTPNGNGRWEQADLAGNVYEWTLDQHFEPYTQVDCNDCSNLAAASFRVARGGSYLDDASILRSSYREPLLSQDVVGMRCARSADQER